jgi:chromosome segregation ATPase
MSAAAKTSFALERFTWEAPDRLGLSGRFSGLPDDGQAIPLLDRSRHDLARARDDLEAEHARHAADAERFREGLSRVRESAERAVAAERLTTQRLEADLQRAHDELGEHERAGAEVDELRAELETAHRQRDEAQARLRDAQQPVAEAHAETEQVLRRLAAAATALDGRP